MTVFSYTIDSKILAAQIRDNKSKSHSSTPSSYIATLRLRYVHAFVMYVCVRARAR